MKIAVIGAGPAGARAAGLLASVGHEVLLFDSHGPWEKPCGGGISTRTLRLHGAIPSQLPIQKIKTMTLYYGDRCSVSLEPSEPMGVVSRKEYFHHMLAEAVSAGADFLEDRVTDLRRVEAHWTLHTHTSSFSADFVVGADGASSLVRRKLGSPLTPEDLSVTLGYFIRGYQSQVLKIFLVPSMEGYLWSFPRPDHVSYGLITRPGPHWTSQGKLLLENYIAADLGEDALEGAEFYSAPVPRLRAGSWKTNTIAGAGWALIGDAAGLVDPITGEGIYYALRSAELLAERLPATGAYEQAVMDTWGAELERAAQLCRLFYSGRFLGASFLKRLVQFARRSATVRSHLSALIAGTQPYIGLRRRLLAAAPQVTLELATSAFRRN